MNRNAFFQIMRLREYNETAALPHCKKSVNYLTLFEGYQTYMSKQDGSITR